MPKEQKTQTIHVIDADGQKHTAKLVHISREELDTLPPAEESEAKTSKK